MVFGASMPNMVLLEESEPNTIYDCPNSLDYKPSVNPTQSIPRVTDNLILHYSTTNSLVVQKIFGLDMAEKQWAPYYDLALRASDQYSVRNPSQ